MYVYLSLASPLGGSSRPQAGDEGKAAGTVRLRDTAARPPLIRPFGPPSPPWGKALLQCCGFSGNGGVLLGNRGGGVGAEAVKFRGQLVVGHG